MNIRVSVKDELVARPRPPISPALTTGTRDWPQPQRGDAEFAQGAVQSERPRLRRLWQDVCFLNLLEARRGVEAAEQMPFSMDGRGAQQHYSNLAAINAVALALEDDTLSASAAAQQALRFGASGAFRRLAGIVSRFCALKAGADLGPVDSFAVRALEAMAAGAMTGPEETFADVLDLTLAAKIELSRLHIVEAEHLACCALRRASVEGGSGAFAVSILARIYYEQGRQHDAEKLLLPRLSVIRAFGSLDCVAQAHLVLARVAANRGDLASGFAILDDAEELALARNWPRLTAVMLAERVRLCGKRNARASDAAQEQLRNLARRHRPATRCARSEIAICALRAELWHHLAFGCGLELRTTLARLKRDAWVRQDLFALAGLDLVEAQLLWTEGDEDGSLDRLGRVLCDAAGRGLPQQLLDAGQPMTEMIARFVKRSGNDRNILSFGITVLDQLQVAVRIVHDGERRSTRPGDGLTAREKDVLRLIAEGNTNKVIAQKQGIAPETIKTHIKNIFAKLSVERRAQAVVKAQSLGLITSTTALSHDQGRTN